MNDDEFDVRDVLGEGLADRGYRYKYAVVAFDRVSTRLGLVRSVLLFNLSKKPQRTLALAGNGDGRIDIWRVSYYLHPQRIVTHLDDPQITDLGMHKDWHQVSLAGIRYSIHPSQWDDARALLGLGQGQRGG